MAEKTWSDLLTNKERDLACAIINVWGTGERPWAERCNLGFFKKDYISSLLAKADGNLTPEYKGAFQSLRLMLDQDYIRGVEF